MVEKNKQKEREEMNEKAKDIPVPVAMVALVGFFNTTEKVSSVS